MATTTAFPKIEYAIFDMDGLDSERIYTQVTNQILGRYGHQLTWEIKSGIMGKVAHEACQYVLSHFPDVPLTVDEYFEERTKIQNDLWTKVPPMAGAAHLVKSLHKQGVPIALATGSSMPNLKLKTGHLQDIFSLFPAESIICADSPQIKPGRGKPQPDIFLVAAQSLGRDVGTADAATDAQKAERAKGIVYEDAIPGVKAGVAAGMNDENLRALDPHNDYGAAQILKSLEEWDPVAWGLQPFPEPTPAPSST